MIKKVYIFLLATSVILLAISIAVKVLAENTFDLTVFGITIANTYSFLWLVFSLYTFFLGSIYIMAERSKLKLRKWMLLAHCVAVVLFLLFFGAINLFNVPEFRSLIAQYNIPLLTLLGIYVLLLVADVVLFISGMIFLAINLFISRKKTEKQEYNNNQ